MHVELEHVGKRFGSLLALHDITLDLPAGTRAALIGPNGAGKSTLTRVIMGMLACEGEVRIDGMSPFFKRVKLARRMAYVPQVAPRLSATVREWIDVVLRLRELDRGSLTHVAAMLGLDLNALARRPVRNLSGGMRQKLLLAMALSSKASLLILDEPTASLDATSRARLFRLVEELPANVTLLLCSHRLEEIRHMVDRVLVLEDGKLAFDGAADSWLGRRSHGILEVRVCGEPATQWLSERGFRRGTTGWWRLEVRNGQRMQVISQMVSTLGKDLCDVVVHDLEKVDEEAGT